MAKQEDNVVNDPAVVEEWLDDDPANELPKSLMVTHFQTVELDQNREPLVLHDLMEQAGLLGEPVKAKDIVGQQFTIYRLRAFRSSFDPRKHAYWCVIKFDPLGDWYTVVLGGETLVDMLDFYAGQNINAPLVVTLTKKTGGAYGGYYVFE